MSAFEEIASVPPPTISHSVLSSSVLSEFPDEPSSDHFCLDSLLANARTKRFKPFFKTLSRAFLDEAYRNAVRDLAGDNAQLVIDAIQNVCFPSHKRAVSFSISRLLEPERFAKQRWVIQACILSSCQARREYYPFTPIALYI